MKKLPKIGDLYYTVSKSQVPQEHTNHFVQTESHGVGFWIPGQSYPGYTLYNICTMKWSDDDFDHETALNEKIYLTRAAAEKAVARLQSQ